MDCFSVFGRQIKFYLSHTSDKVYIFEYMCSYSASLFDFVQLSGDNLVPLVAGSRVKPEQDYAEHINVSFI